MRTQRFRDDPLTREIIGAAVEVHRELGPGLLESVYEIARCHEFEMRRVYFERQVLVDLFYKGHTLKGQRLDLVVDRQVVVEAKSSQALSPIAFAQVLSYLRASGMTRGLILNFGTVRLTDGIKRLSL